MDADTMSHLKKGLTFGSLIRLPSTVTLSWKDMASLLASDGYVRPFEHVRYGWSHDLKLPITWCI